MIRLYTSTGEEKPITEYTDYHITHVTNGLDELTLSIPENSDIYQYIYEEAKIVDDYNKWLVKKIDDDVILCELDFDFLKQTVYKDYVSSTRLLQEVLEDHLPNGWIIAGNTSTIKRTIEFDFCTDYDVIVECANTYDVYFQWDMLNQVLTVVNPALSQSTGVYISSELNLKIINFKGNSTEFATRLYAYGKDGMSIASAVVDGKTYGKPYVDDNTYSNKIVCAYWNDDRYTVPENLYADAVEKLKTLAIPVRSYECNVIDLAKQNPDYDFLDFKMFKLVTLMDVERGINIEHRIVEYVEYPDEPELNVITMATVTTKLTDKMNDLFSVAEEQQEKIATDLDAKILMATAMLTGAFGSHVISEDGNIYITDNENLASAQVVWRWNVNGIGKSTTGVEGPYTTALTFDDNFITSVITAMIVRADKVVTGKLQGPNSESYWDFDNDEIHIAGYTTESDVGNMIDINNEELSSLYYGKIEVDGKIADTETKITQSADAIMSTVSETYQTKSGMGDYSTTVQMNSAIEQSASGILTTVSETYDGKEIASRINQSADSVVIEASHIQLTGKNIADRINDSDSSITISATHINLTGANIADRLNAADSDVKITANHINLTGEVTISDLDSSLADALVTGVTTKLQYYLSTSSSQATGGSWQDTVPAWGQSKFVWVRVATTKKYSSGSEQTTYSTETYDENLTTALSESAAAKSLAQSAKATADGKIVTYYQSYEPSSANTGDLWIDTDDGNKLYRYSGSSWLNAQDTAIQSALTNAADAKSVADKKIITFAQDSTPTATDVGDLWIDTDDDNRLYRWSGSAWVSVRDGSISSANALAQNALDTAKSKIVTYYQTSEPTGATSGDLWIDTGNGNKLSRYNGSVWVSVQDEGIKTALTNAANAKAIADNKIVTFAQTSEPTATDIGDLWIDTDDSNKMYRWNGTTWISVRDTGIATAQAMAESANSTQVSLYYRSSSATAPTINTSSSIGTSDNTDNAWEYVMPKPKYGCYFFTCERYTSVKGTVTFSTVRQMSNLTYTSLWCSSNDSTYIDGGRIYAASVTSDQLAANSVTANKIESGAITTDKIDAGAVTAVKIDSGAVTTDKLAAGAVTAAKIATEAIAIGNLNEDAQAALVTNVITQDQYALGPSSIDPPTDATWSSTAPTIVTGQTLWKRTTTTKTFASGGTTVSYSYSVETNINTAATNAEEAKTTAEEAKENVPVVNLMPGMYLYEFSYGSSRTLNGITWVANADGTITATGTATANSYYYLNGEDFGRAVPVTLIDPTKKYVFHAVPEGGSTSSYYAQIRYTANGTTPSSSSGSTKRDTGSGATIPKGYWSVFCCLFIANGYDCGDGITFKPMLETGTTVHNYVSSHDGVGAIPAFTVKSTVSCYYRSTTNTAPSITSSTSIGTAVNTDNAWEYVMPRPKKGCYFYTCERYTYANGAISFSTVREIPNASYASKWCSSNDSAYIDGGAIYANSVTAAKIDVDDLFAQSITASDFNITGGSINIITSSETTDKITLSYDIHKLTLSPGYLGVRNSTEKMLTQSQSTGCLSLYNTSGSTYRIVSFIGGVRASTSDPFYGSISLYNSSGTRNVNISGETGAFTGCLASNMFKTKSVTLIDAQSLAGDGYVSKNVTFTPDTGYTAVGIVGWELNTSDGRAYARYMNIYACYFSSATNIYVNLCNTGTNTRTVTLKAIVLQMKTSV